MGKYEAIEKIIASDKINKEKKLYFIQSLLMNWLTVKEISWIWE